MKISNTLMLPVLALALSLSSFTTEAAEKKENSQKEQKSKNTSFDAFLFKVPNTNKVKLVIDKNIDTRLRILLTGKDGNIYYNETNDDNGLKYRRLFDMNDLAEGVYYFELYSKKQTIIKEIKIRNASEKLVSLL